ncbi:MAG TPA: ADOP family duplicated permease [Gemmatimonadaceae bacterium]|nr:ADOP family duplicated permease [Gemmatimonadaceae bacterium]
MTAHRPPRAALALLETFLPADSREVVIGDLVESFESDVSRHPVAARLRFWRETLAAIGPLQFAPQSVSAFNPPSMETRVQTFLSDLRHAGRSLARARGFTVLCTTTLGLAIGATAAIFSVANPLLFASLPYRDANRLVTVWERDPGGGTSRTTYATYLDLRHDSKTLEHSAVLSNWDVTIFGDQDAERTRGSRVTWEFFRTLGVRPMLGRDFTEADDTPDNSSVVILSHHLWARRFGSDSSVLGRVIDINGVRRTVIGVMPPDFENVLFPLDEIWRPLGYTSGGDSACRTCHHLVMLARVRAGTLLGAAGKELDAIATRLAEQYPNDYATPGAIVEGLQDNVTKSTRAILIALIAAVLVVLGIAVTNVVSLQLARAARRQEEFAVRAALGAGRGRLAGQLFTEGLVLALLGGVAGVAIAAVALPGLISQLPPEMPRLAAIHLSWPTLLLVSAIVLGVAIVTALVPLTTAGASRLFDTLRSGARSLGGAHHRARATLVIGEVALAMMLLVGAGLLGRSLMRLLSVNAGFDPGHLVTMQVHATGTAYTQRPTIQANHDRILESVRALPGVEAAGLTAILPLGGNYDDRGIAVRDKPVDNPALQPSAMRYTVTADYLRAMRIPVLRGRAFTEAEGRDTTTRVTLVSDAMARRIWPGENPIGKEIKLDGATRPWMTVIGVTANVRHTGLDEGDRMAFYVPEPQWQDAESQMILVVRTKGDPAAMVSSIREAVRRVDSRQPITNVATMRGVVAGSTAQRRLGFLLFIAFSAMALLLAAAGIYGILAGSVAERTREIGLRSALGASRGAIAGLVLKQSASLAGVGLVVGIGASLALARYLRALLFGLEASDPVSLAAAVAVIGAIAVIACIIPARRALHVDPMVALRHE